MVPSEGNGRPVRKDQFIARIRRDRTAFDAILAAIPFERREEPGSGASGWTVKDVLWHIAWGDRQNEGVIRARALVGSELWQRSEDERNAAVVEEGRSKTLQEVLKEYEESYRDLVSAIEGLSERELNEPDRWQGMSQRAPGWRPWRFLYDPTHYEQHGRWIEQGLRVNRQRP